MQISTAQHSDGVSTGMQPVFTVSAERSSWTDGQDRDEYSANPGRVNLKSGQNRIRFRLGLQLAQATDARSSIPGDESTAILNPTTCFGRPRYVQIGEP